MYQSPSKAKRLYFDVIPKNVDEYLTFNRKYHEEPELTKQLANPAYHIHDGNVPKIETFGISFNLLLNLASACNPSDKKVLWGFISKYAADATPEKAPYLDHLTSFAVEYYNNFIKINKQYLEPLESHKKILQAIYDMLGALPSSANAEEIQGKIYEIGTNAGYENLRDYFKELYQILLGQTEGPRLGSFIQLFGIEKTRELINTSHSHSQA